MKKRILVLIAGLTMSGVKAQQNDSLFIPGDTVKNQPKISLDSPLGKVNERGQRFRSLIIPGVLITYGLVSMGNNGLKRVNEEVKEEVWSDHPHQLRHFDNFLKFAPAISVYALNAVGIHGKNNFRDRTMIYLLANMITNGFVFSLKGITHQLRPDGSSYTSFPSGHAAEAFASAEFLRQEYKDLSPLYGVAGYAMALVTGYNRLYNNKHWLGDVVAGAGFGIASTKISYWIYPKIKKWLFNDKPTNTVILPAWQNHTVGLNLVHRF
jgi:PAP2 superfamily